MRFLVRVGAKVNQRLAKFKLDEGDDLGHPSHEARLVSCNDLIFCDGMLLLVAYLG